jgi:hypothetical protein
VSRNPGSRLDELVSSLSATGTTLVTVAADASDEAAMGALFDRFGTDLPPLAGIYLAAFGGGPITLRDMTDDDVIAMFRPKLDVVSVLHNLSSITRCAKRLFVDLGSARFAVARALHGDQCLPGHLRLCAPGSGPAGHGDQLGTLEVVVRHPNQPGASGDPRFWSRPDARRDRDPGPPVGQWPRRPFTHYRRRDWKSGHPRIAPTALHIVDDMLPTTPTA